MKQLELFKKSRPSVKEMADIVNGWLDEEDPKVIYDFYSKSKQQLITYHLGLGRKIRNYFKLWTYEWKPELDKGVDISNEHPDQVSFRVIVEVWRRGQEEFNT